MDDDYAAKIWSSLHDQKLLHRCFWDGSNQTPDEFLGFVRHPQTTVFSVENEVETFALVWITDWPSRYTACLHFCGLRNTWGKLSLQIGQFVHFNLFNATRADGDAYLKVAVGYLPATNVLALKYIEKLGYKKKSVIPGACHLHYQKRDVDAVVAYCTKETFMEN